MPGRTLLLLLALATAAPSVALADPPDYFGGDAPPEDITFRNDKPRTTRQRILLAGLFGGAVVMGGVGLGFHLDSRSKSDQVSAVGDHTGRVYTAEVDDTRRAALRSRTLAIVGYSAGGALLLAGIITYFVTQPGSDVVTVGKPKNATPPPPPVPVTIAPLPGGALAQAAWSF
ncbi:MAG TPA: hypothetical protein VL172_15745 [Kofleriaceae bacterium]|nr:hypothetical protein [Kofleriaceae bacterium]